MRRGLAWLRGFAVTVREGRAASGSSVVSGLNGTVLNIMSVNAALLLPRVAAAGAAESHSHHSTNVPATVVGCTAGGGFRVASPTFLRRISDLYTD